MKTKQLLFTIGLLFSIAFMNAQDKYEFMIIEYSTLVVPKISISIDGVEFIEKIIKLPKEENEVSNAKPFLQKIKEYQDQNWEVMSINSTYKNASPAHFAHLRKKIK